MTATTTQLEQTTVLLESLHASYGAILEEAKQQLEKVDITDTAIDRITDGLTNNANLLRRVSRISCDGMIERIINETGDVSDSREKKLIDTLAAAVGNRLGDALQVQLDTQLKAFFDSGVIEKAIEDRITKNPELLSAVQTKATLKQAFALAFDLDMTEEDTTPAAETDDKPF